MAKRGRKPSPTRKSPIENLTCGICGKLKKVSNYYLSYNSIHSKTRRIPYCKDCLKNMIYDENNQFNISGLKEALKLIDKPFLNDILISSMEQEGETFGVYMKNLALQQNRSLAWKDSIFESEEGNNEIFSDLNNEDNYDINLLKKKYGEGYNKIEYLAFERKYQLFKNNYVEKTSMHTEALLNYIRYRVKEELATAQDKIKDAKDWGSLAEKAATAAKINPSQLSVADLTDGLSTFGQLVRAAEKVEDIISILPKYKEKPQDKVDFNLFCYINYIRDLKGLPLCEYKDIYQFYEQRKKEHVDRLDFLIEGDDN